MAKGEPAANGPRGGCLPLLGVLFAAGGVALAIYTWQLPERSHSASDLILRKTMPVILAGIGLVMIAMGSLDSRAGRTLAALAARQPDKPWLWRDDWEQGYARPEAGSQALNWLLLGSAAAADLGAARFAASE
jgi:hypothetical protein